MQKSGLRVFVVVFGFTFLLHALSSSLLSQSIWQKMKDAAKQAEQQGQPQNQPQQRPGQQRPGQQPAQGRAQGRGAGDDTGPITPPAGTKIEESMVAPVQDRAKFEISPHGLHVATVETEGSRAVVWYDGVEGPKFDEIITQTNFNSIVFSPDGQHYSYCARSGSQYVVVLDGKELVSSSESQDGNFTSTSCHLGFTSNSKHLFFLSQVATISPSTSYSRFVFDGKPEPPAYSMPDDFRPFAFSPDGDHYAYVWNDPNRQKPYVLIIDGKPAPYQAGAPQWTSDSKHLYTQRAVAGAGNNPNVELLLDGKPIARGYVFRIYTSPASDMVVMAVSGGVNFHPYSFLVVNGKKAPGSDTVERGQIQKVEISPDGKHYAALYEDLSNHYYVITDGKRGQDYSSVTELAFTPDSSTVIYQAMENGKMFLVANDHEYGGVVGGGLAKYVLAPVGNRFAVALSPNGVPGLIVDGKNVPFRERGLSGLSFSPDGQHFGYLVSDGGKDSRLVLDGAPVGSSTVNGSVDLAPPLDRQFLFSPDSKHVAHFAGTETAKGVAIDGKFFPLSPEGLQQFLRFSPDSKHVFWLHHFTVQGVERARLYADGKPLLEFFSPAWRTPDWFDFNPDGSISMLTQDDQSLKRVTIRLAPESSMETLLGGRSGAMQARQ